MLKKLFLLLIVIAPLSMFAQDKFAHVNYQEIFSKMPEIAGVQAKLKAKEEAIKKNAAAIEDEYTKKVQEYGALTAETAPSVRGDLEKQIQQLQERFENFRQTSQLDLQQEQQGLVTPLHTKLQNAIKEVGDEHSYTYILDSSSLLYVNPSAVDANKLVKTKLGITE